MLFKKQRQSGFIYPKDYPNKFVGLVKLQFLAKKVHRFLRIQRYFTKIFGYQYSPSHDLIEIDITYLCNLRCHNCNRSSAQAPERLHITLQQIQNFVSETITQNRYWRRIRILGGEPTLHPDFLAILDALLVLKAAKLVSSIEVVTNGYGAKVNKMLLILPKGITVENSAKAGNVQPSFGPFNMAPCDDKWFKFAEFRHGCDIMNSCGVGLTPLGYYPCAVAGGIDRISQLGRGRQTLPSPNDDMRDLLERNCRLCGRFRDGHYVPEKLRPPIYQQLTSPTWHSLYQRWRERNSK